MERRSDRTLSSFGKKHARGDTPRISLTPATEEPIVQVAEDIGQQRSRLEEIKALMKSRSMGSSAGASTSLAENKQVSTSNESSEILQTLNPFISEDDGDQKLPVPSRKTSEVGEKLSEMINLVLPISALPRRLMNLNLDKDNNDLHFSSMATSMVPAPEKLEDSPKFLPIYVTKPSDYSDRQSNEFRDPECTSVVSDLDVEIRIEEMPKSQEDLYSNDQGDFFSFKDRLTTPGMIGNSGLFDQDPTHLSLRIRPKANTLSERRGPLEESFSFRRSSEADSNNKHDDIILTVVEIDNTGKVNKSREASLIHSKRRETSCEDPQTQSKDYSEFKEGDRIDFEIKASYSDPRIRVEGVVVKPSQIEHSQCDFAMIDSSTGKRYTLRIQKRDLIAVPRNETFGQVENNSMVSDDGVPDFGKGSSAWNSKIMNISGTNRVNLGSAHLSLSPIVRESGKEVTHYRGFLANGQEIIEPVLVSKRIDGYVRVKTESLRIYRVQVEKEHQDRVQNIDVLNFELNKQSELHLQHPLKPEVLSVVLIEFEFEFSPYLQGERAVLNLKSGTRLEGELKLIQTPSFKGRGPPSNDSSKSGRQLHFIVEPTTSDCRKRSKEEQMRLLTQSEHDYASTFQKEIECYSVDLIQLKQAISTDTLICWLRPSILQYCLTKNINPDLTWIPPREVDSQLFDRGDDESKTQKITITDKNGNIINIYTNESRSIDSEELSESFESDEFYPNDDIYKVEIGGKLLIPTFKKRKPENSQQQSIKHSRSPPIHAKVYQIKRKHTGAGYAGVPGQKQLVSGISDELFPSMMRNKMRSAGSYHNKPQNSGSLSSGNDMVNSNDYAGFQNMPKRPMPFPGSENIPFQKQDQDMYYNWVAQPNLNRNKYEFQQMMAYDPDVVYDPREIAAHQNKKRLPYGPAQNNITQSSREDNSKSITDKSHSYILDKILDKESIFSEIPKKTDRPFVGSNVSDIMPIINGKVPKIMMPKDTMRTTANFNPPSVISNINQADGKSVSVPSDLGLGLQPKKCESDDEEEEEKYNRKSSRRSSRSRSADPHERDRQQPENNVSLHILQSTVTRVMEEMATIKKPSTTSSDPVLFIRPQDKKQRSKQAKTRGSKMKIYLDTDEGRTIEFVSTEVVSLEMILSTLNPQSPGRLHQTPDRQMLQLSSILNSSISKGRNRSRRNILARGVAQIRQLEHLVDLVITKGSSGYSAILARLSSQDTADAG